MLQPLRLGFAEPPPLSGADSPYQGEMSRRDKRGRDAGSAQPRLRGCRRSAGKDPNRKFSLRFGKEETSTEDKKPCLQGFVPSWSFLTRLRRPYLFSRKRKDRGEKSAWTRLGPPCGERKSKAPLKGELSAKLTERLPQICCDLSVTAPPCHLPLVGEGMGVISGSASRR